MMDLADVARYPVDHSFFARDVAAFFRESAIIQRGIDPNPERDEIHYAD